MAFTLSEAVDFCHVVFVISGVVALDLECWMLSVACWVGTEYGGEQMVIRHAGVARTRISWIGRMEDIDIDVEDGQLVIDLGSCFVGWRIEEKKKKKGERISLSSTVFISLFVITRGEALR